MVVTCTQFLRYQRGLKIIVRLEQLYRKRVHLKIVSLIQDNLRGERVCDGLSLTSFFDNIEQLAEDSS